MNKLKLVFLRSLLLALLLPVLLVSITPSNALAQLQEPPVRGTGEALTPLSLGLQNRIGLTFLLNNFGFGVSGTYAQVIGPFTELTFTASITGIRDVSAQEFIYFQTGRKVVPNRYRRALGFPLMAGIEQRLFPNVIADNFRFFVSVDGGPAFAYTYPYFEDALTPGYRDYFLLRTNLGIITRRPKKLTASLEDWAAGTGISVLRAI